MSELPVPIPIDAIRAAEERIVDIAFRTPLVPLYGHPHILLKLETAQPIRSFKIRGAANAMGSADCSRGVYTASAGNMAQGVAWCARKAGVPCTVIVPDSAPAKKVAAVEALGGHVVRVPFDVWWQAMIEHGQEGMPGLFVHPFEDAAVAAGNGTIALEVLAGCPQLAAIYVPWGGGGLAYGIASALHHLSPGTQVFGVEPATAHPLADSLAARRPMTVDVTRSFVDGIGGKSLFPSMWPVAQTLLAGSVVVSLSEIADAVRLLHSHHGVTAEGAGAASVAAALKAPVQNGTIVAVVSGGNIDDSALRPILAGRLP